jgi:Domain of unknown function (DUF4175)
MRIAILLMMPALLLVPPALAQVSQAPAAAITEMTPIEIVARRRVKPGRLKIQLLERPRPPQFGSENLRVWYRLGNASEHADVSLRIRQGLQSRTWPIARHDDLTAQELESTTLADVTEDVFAGQDVRMSLVVRDGRGRVAASKSFNATVPQRFFLHPLGREIAGVRKDMIARVLTRAEAKARVVQLSAAAVDARVDTTVLAALRQTYWRLEYDASADAAFDLMWLIANHLEDSRRLSLAGLSNHLDHALSEQDIPLLPTP